MKIVQYTVWDFIEGFKHPANPCLLLLAITFFVSLLVRRQGRFPDPGGRVLGGGDLDAGYRDPQLEEGTFKVQNLFALPKNIFGLNFQSEPLSSPPSTSSQSSRVSGSTGTWS